MGSVAPRSGCARHANPTNFGTDMRLLSKYQMLGFPTSVINRLSKRELRAR